LLPPELRDPLDFVPPEDFLEPLLFIDVDPDDFLEPLLLIDFDPELFFEPLLLILFELLPFELFEPLLLGFL
jgi:hypothetical protein